jgi:hypothetical protein
MEEIAISKFKATCLAVLERVRKTGKTFLVTLAQKTIGKPCADEAAARDPAPSQLTRAA